MARLSGQSPHTARPLRRGREEAAERPGGGGGSTNTVQPETQETGEGDVPSPSPRQPLPHGAISNRCTAMRGILSAVNVNTLTEIPFLLPMARYPVLSPRTARPLWKGREEVAKRPGGGGSRRIPFNQRHRGQGRGTSPSPFSVSPSPTGVILHRYGVRGFGSLVAISPDTPERSSLRPCTVSGAISIHLPARLSWPWRRGWPT